MNLIFNLDKKISFYMLQFYKNHGLNQIMKFVSSTGDFGMIWIAIIILLNLVKKNNAGELTLMALFYSMLIGQITIKTIVRRKRPCHIYQDVELLINRPTDYSFPSGHTCTSFACAIIILYYFGWIGVLSLIWAVLMGISRIYLFVHYFSDVFAGMILGIVVAVVLLMM